MMIGTIALGFLVLLLTILTLAGAVGQWRIRQLQRAFDGESERRGIRSEYLETFRGRILGFDRRQGKLLYLWRHGRKKQSALVSLSEIKQYRFRKRYLKTPYQYFNGGVQLLLSDIVLELECSNGPLLTIPFFHYRLDPAKEAVGAESKMKRWEQILGQHLKTA